MGADVDHYVPLTRKYELTFSWSNWLWICPTCNRHKSNRFPVSSTGSALLIDPSRSNPWDHFILVSSTGLLAPRYVSDDDNFDVIGNSTLDLLPCLNNEAVAEGRLRNIRRLRRAVSDVINQNASTSSRIRLAAEIEEDDYGISSWFFLREGSGEDVFKTLAEQFPTLWQGVVRRCVRDQA